MTLYREGRGPDEYEPAEDDEIMDEAVKIAHQRAERLWRGSDAPNAGAVLPTSPEPDQEPSAHGVARTETTEPDDTKADDGGVSSALTKAQFEMIREFFEVWPKQQNPRVWALIAEVDRLHPEWDLPPPAVLWRVNRTSTILVSSPTMEAAKEVADRQLGETVVMSAVEADKVMNDD